MIVSFKYFLIFLNFKLSIVVAVEIEAVMVVIVVVVVGLCYHFDLLPYSFPESSK